jgi:hypothetical protein
MTEKATSVDNSLTLFISSSSLFYILPALVILVLLVITLPQPPASLIYIYRDTGELRGSDPLLRLIYPSATADQERPGNRLRAG